MIVQLLLNLMGIFIAGAIVYLTYLLSRTLKGGSAGMLQDFCWLFDNTPALNSFLMFVLQIVIASNTIACSLKSISNHIIISLEIIYLFSILMLVLFHTLKEAGKPLVKEA